MKGYLPVKVKKVRRKMAEEKRRRKRR